MASVRKGSQVSVRPRSDEKMEAGGLNLGRRLSQIEDLKLAVRAADRAEFASEGEVSAVFAKYN